MSYHICENCVHSTSTLSSWLAEQEVRGSIPGLATWISEIGYLLLPRSDMAEIPLKRHKFTIQPTNQYYGNSRSYIIFCWFIATLVNNFDGFSQDKIGIKCSESFIFFITVSMEKFQKIGYLNHVRKGVVACPKLECIWTNRIYHYTPEGTKESHPSVHDLQSTTRLAESWMSQIMDTRMGFPCPFRGVVIDYFSPTPFICPFPGIFGTFLSTMGEKILLPMWTELSRK